jgi:hypothetical protein
MLEELMQSIVKFVQVLSNLLSHPKVKARVALKNLVGMILETCLCQNIQDVFHVLKMKDLFHF